VRIKGIMPDDGGVRRAMAATPRPASIFRNVGRHAPERDGRCHGDVTGDRRIDGRPAAVQPASVEPGRAIVGRGPRTTETGSGTMDIWTHYLDGVERQVRLDGFMTRVMRDNLAKLRTGADEDVGRRIDGLVSQFHRPYARIRRRIARVH
jgi:hypothetical protein